MYHASTNANSASMCIIDDTLVFWSNKENEDDSQPAVIENKRNAINKAVDY